MNYRNVLLDGRLPLPAKQAFANKFPKQIEQINRMWNALWYNFLLDEGAINATLWYDRIGGNVFNDIIVPLSMQGWITSTTIPQRNWSEIQLNKDKLLQFVTPDELINIRAQHKYDKYILRNTESKAVKVTSLNGKLQDTGLVRKGFQQAGNTPFKYDMDMLSVNKEAVLLELNKSMDKIRQEYPDMRADAATYDQVSTAIYEWHEANPDEEFTTGNNFNDSRGRAISQVLKKIANPISSKNFRAALVIPEAYRNYATPEGAKAIFLFIAELNGFKSGTFEDKLEFGQQCWFNETLHELNLDEEGGRKDYHENIWLARLYEELNAFYNLDVDANYQVRKLAHYVGDYNDKHKWATPIELDASASMLQYMGILLGDERLCEMTNLIGTKLSDPWAIDGIPRNQFKKAATPQTYGSSQTCQTLWAKAKIEYTTEQVRIYNRELAQGALGVANLFKEFIIRNCNPTEMMKLHVWDEQFLVECNRYRTVGEEFHGYSIYDTESSSIKDIIHMKTKKVPDLEQFRRYFVTALIHNLDSQVADYVIGKVMKLFGWGLPIHDAFIVCPEAAKTTREFYAQKIDEIYENRETILLNYFRSIGITNAALAQWKQLMERVHKVENFKCGLMALK